MTEKCPVCKNNIKINDRACSVCGFADLHREFITKEDGELWVKNVVEPYRKQYEESLSKGQYNAEGYDRMGYDRNGYDKEGYNRSGYNKEGFYKLTGLNHEGYDRDGYDKNGFNKEGYNRSGYDKDGFDRNGYNRSGYDKNGYNALGHDEKGYSKQDKENNISAFWGIMYYLIMSGITTAFLSYFVSYDMFDNDDSEMALMFIGVIIFMLLQFIPVGVESKSESIHRFARITIALIIIVGLVVSIICAIKQEMFIFTIFGLIINLGSALRLLKFIS